MIAITDILSLLAIAQTGFTIIYLLTHRQNRTQDRLIALLLLFMCMPPIMKTVMHNLEAGTPGVLARMRGFGFMFGPLLFLAIHARLHGGRERKLPRLWFIHFLPGIALETALLWKGYVLPPRPEIITGPPATRPPHWFGLLYSGTMILSALGYSVWSLAWIQGIQSRYRKINGPMSVHPLLGSTRAMVFAVLVVFLLMLSTGIAQNILREQIGWLHAGTFLLGIYAVSFLAIRWSMQKLPATLGDIADKFPPTHALNNALPIPANKSSESHISPVQANIGQSTDDTITDSIVGTRHDSNVTLNSNLAIDATNAVEKSETLPVEAAGPTDAGVAEQDNGEFDERNTNDSNGSQGLHATADPNPEVRTTRYSRTGLNPEEAKRLSKRVTAYMQNKRPYLNDEFSLDDLKSALNVPRHHISQVINDIFGQNFYAYVNDYRVAEACRLLRSPDYRDHPVARIGMECGFVSRSVFYEVFRKKLGTTPAAYRLKKDNTG